MKRSEKSILLEINRELIRRGYLTTKLHGSSYQQAGLPDLLAIKEGKAHWIEVKRPGGKTTKIQEHMMGKLRAAGCVCLVATGLADLDGMR